MLNSRFIIITFPTGAPEKSLQASNTFFFDQLSSTLNNLFDYDITSKRKLHITLRKNDLSIYSSLNEINIDLSYEKNYQLIIEYNDTDRTILALYDYYFTQIPERNLYRVCMEHLFLHTAKYSNEVIYNNKRLNDSITYGALTEIALHNPGNLNFYTRGLLLADYINNYPPKESYKIIKKISMTAQEMVFGLLGDEKEITSRIKHSLTPIPQINFDDFDKKVMLDILREYGSFEIVGPQIEKLTTLASRVLNKAKEIFALPEERLKLTEDPKDFNGYKNIFKQTKEIVSKAKKGNILHQQSYFYKPYNPRVPEGIDLSVLNEYYHQCLAIQHCVYRQIALCLKIDPKDLSSYSNDERSVLSLKHYPAMNTGDIGIQEHSDYGILTFVVSNQRGLEIKKNEEWIAAPHEPLLRCYVNIGDWLLFQLNNPSFKPGIHRVPTIQEERYSAMVFYLPPLDEKRRTPNGKITAYRNFLFSDKSDYISNQVDSTVSDPTLTPVIQAKSKQI